MTVFPQKQRLFFLLVTTPNPFQRSSEFLKTEASVFFLLPCMSLPSYLCLILMSLTLWYVSFPLLVHVCLSDISRLISLKQRWETNFALQIAMMSVCVSSLFQILKVIYLISRTSVWPLWYWRSSRWFLLIFWDHYPQ